MTDVLQQAIDALQIRDVYLRRSESQLAEGFEPKLDPDVDTLEVQFQHLISHFSVLELEVEGEAPIQLFRVFVQLGARWLAPAPDGDTASDTDDGNRLKALIAGVMVAEYDMRTDPGAEALKAFALRNASYHVWPYWREFLSAQCLRMNLPKLVLPAVQFGVRALED